MARAGMSGVIGELRQMTNSGTADYSIAGTTYWTDDQLQAVLDGYQARQVERLKAEPIDTNSTTQYFSWVWEHPNPEQATSGTAYWQLRDGNLAAVGTANYSVNYDQKRVTFATDQTGTASYTLTYFTYDLYGAAAEVFRKKAAHVAARYDVSTDNHSLKQSQLRQSYLDMAKSMEAAGGSRFVSVKRTDSRW